MDEKILKQTDEYYSEKIVQFGTTSRGVDWNSVESQRTSFKQLTKILSMENSMEVSVCDYGCGYGYYSEYLRELGYKGKYTGVDISEDMIRAARAKYGDAKDTCFIKGAELDQEYDYIIASGIFNVRQGVEFDKWTQYMIEVLQKFHMHAKKGFAFNCLTKYSDAEYMKDYLYYADPLYYFDYCKKNFSRNVALLHDYDLYEFTMLIRK